MDEAGEERMRGSSRRETRAFNSHHFGGAADQEKLSTAARFFDWIIDGFEPWIRGRVLEVGAGSGAVSSRILERHKELSIVALEPAANMYRVLEETAGSNPRLTAFRSTLEDYDQDGSFDTVLYISVLEHVEDDATELKLAASTLRPGGAVLVFVPAFEGLYSELDYKTGHYRRYTLEQLRTLAENAGLEVQDIRYFDLLGLISYFFLYRLLGRTEVSDFSVGFYDSIVVPLSRGIQTVFRNRPPAGKNVQMIATKSDYSH